MLIRISLIFLVVSLAKLVDCRPPDPRCEAMRIPWCLGVYDAVIFPNRLGHRNQVDAYYAMHKLWPLIQLQCSPQILHYLCRLYAPQCPFVQSRDTNHISYHPEQSRPPCEDACAKVRYDCHATLEKYHIYWPDELQCEKLRNSDCIETPQVGITPAQPFYAPEATTGQTQGAVEELTTIREILTTTEASSESAESKEEPTTATPEMEAQSTTEKSSEDADNAVTPEGEEPSQSPAPEENEGSAEGVIGVTETQTITTVAPDHPSTVIEDTSGSLLGIAPEIQEKDKVEASSTHHDDDEATETETTEPSAAESELDTTPVAQEGETADVQPADSDDNLSPTPLASEDDKSPRSDRVTAGAELSLGKNDFRVKLMMIYFSVLSLISHYSS